MTHRHVWTAALDDRGMVEFRDAGRGDITIPIPGLDTADIVVLATGDLSVEAVAALLEQLAPHVRGRLTLRLAE